MRTPPLPTAPHALLAWPALLAVGGGLAAWFLVVQAFWGGFGAGHAELWASPDSVTYREVAAWIAGGPATENTLIRPFFYPALLAAALSLMGPAGPLVLQTAAWIGTGVSVYAGAALVTGRRAWALAATALFASNLSLMLLVRQALTEPVAAFLLGLLAVVWARRLHRPTRAGLLGAVLLAALLTAVKPVYVLVLLPTAGYAAWRGVRAAGGVRRGRFAVGLALALLPVAVQLGIMRHQHGLWALSTIGERAVADYFVPRVYGAVRGVSVEAARAQTGPLSAAAHRRFLLGHPGATLRTFAGLVVENVAARSNAIRPDQRAAYLYMRAWNAAALAVHVAGLVALGVALVRWRRRRAWPPAEVALALAVPVYAVLLTAGLTYWQGDRIVLPVLPVWLVLYPLVLTAVSPRARARRS